MKINNITIGAKRTKNFQSFEVSYNIELDKDEDDIKIVKEFQDKVNKLCEEELKRV